MTVEYVGADGDVSEKKPKEPHEKRIEPVTYPRAYQLEPVNEGSYLSLSPLMNSSTMRRATSSENCFMGCFMV